MKLNLNIFKMKLLKLVEKVTKFIKILTKETLHH